jgi:tetratricopeptide (TPR) repeat protein
MGLSMVVVAGGFFVERWTRPTDEPPPGVVRPALEPAGVPPERSPASTAAATEQLIDEGRQIADQLAETFPQDAPALALAGQIQFALGNATTAVQWWERSVALDPACGEAWSGLAEAHWERGDFEQAATCMQRVRATHPQLADERIYVLVDSLLNLGREDEAIAALETRSQASVLAAPGRVVLGQAYLQAEDYPSAQREFAAALVAAPRLAAAHYGLAEALAQLGRTAEAQMHREQYARLKQQDLAAWDRMRGAGRGIEKVNPAEVRGVVSAFCLRAGSLYAAHRRLADAAHYWQRALVLDPANREAQRSLESLPSGPGRIAN